MPEPGEATAAIKNLIGKLMGEHKIRIKKLRKTRKDRSNPPILPSRISYV
jgi:hypothetical protein